MNGARMNYIFMPVDYVRGLNQQGKRKKASAFMEYFNDVDFGDINAIRFYAKSWEVSVGTVHGWLKEFNYEIDRFFANWQIRNSQHYSSVQKQTEQQLNKLNTSKAHNLGNVEKVNEQQLNEDFNTNNNKRGIPFFDPHFEEMYSMCRMFSKTTGSKQDAFNEYQNHLHVKHADMRFAYITYVNDPNGANNGRYFGLANFMKNGMYMSYLRPIIRITLDNEIVVGEYDKDRGVVVTDNIVRPLTVERFTELLGQNKIELLQTTASKKVSNG